MSLEKKDLVERLKFYGLRHFDSEMYWEWGAAKLGKHAGRIDRLRQRAGEDDSPARLREFMDYVAAPKLRGVVASQQTDDLAQAIWMASQHIAQNARVLDLGCDVGMSSTWFARRVGKGSEVVGIDFAAKAIAAACQLARTLSVRNVRFEVMDFERQLPPGPFGTVVDMAAVQYAREPASVYRRISELVLPEGVIACIPMIGRAAELDDILAMLATAGLRVRSLDFVYARDLGRNIARPIIIASARGDAIEVDVYSAMRDARERVTGPRITPFFEAAGS